MSHVSLITKREPAEIHIEFRRALLGGSPESLRQCLAAGADWRQRVGASTPVELLCQREGAISADLLAVLIEFGAAEEIKSSCSYPGLMSLAAMSGSPGAARKVGLLAEAGADARATVDGETPLMRVCSQREESVEVIRVLVAMGVGVNDVSPQGRTALDMAFIESGIDNVVVLAELGGRFNPSEIKGWVKMRADAGVSAVFEALAERQELAEEARAPRPTKSRAAL